MAQQIDYKSTVALVSKLEKEILASTLSEKYVSISMYGVDLSIFVQDLTDDEKTALDAIVAAHVPFDPSASARAAMVDAMNFGRDVIIECGTYNTTRSLTSAQIKDITTKTSDLTMALLTGNLYVAIDELALVPTDDALLTEAWLTEIRNSIQDYLEIPRT